MLDLLKECIVEPVRDFFVNIIKEQVGYLWYYEENVEILKDKICKLNAMIDDMTKKISDVERQAYESVSLEAQLWQIEADGKIKDYGNEFQEHSITKARCSKWWPCPNLKTRLHLSKKAKGMAVVVDSLLAGPQEVAVPLPPPPMTFLYKDIPCQDSRQGIMKDAIEALRNEDTCMIGFWGHGGVGKTTMAEGIQDVFEKEKLCDELAKAVVSQTPDIRKIQDQIADRLGLNFQPKSTEGRADQLLRRLLDSKAKLIVLDDLWDELNLLDIGLPQKNSKCKIILTSRSGEVLRNKMGCSRLFEIPFLTEIEAWHLFKENAGTCVDDPSLKLTAEQVAGECGGLPIALKIVGKALRDQPRHKWEHVLQQLKKPNTSSPDDIIKIYSTIEISYNYLKSEEHKSCLMLCCLFPEDSIITMDYLVLNGWGLGIFDYDSLRETRNGVQVIIDDLKESSLLMSDKSDTDVKMHDVVRDTAL